MTGLDRYHTPKTRPMSYRRAALVACLDIRLPELEVAGALAALSKLDKEDHLFSRDIVAVDMRLPDRLVVQLSDDVAKAREKLYDDKKPKKKAGDA